MVRIVVIGDLTVVRGGDFAKTVGDGGRLTVVFNSVRQDPLTVSTTVVDGTGDYVLFAVVSVETGFNSTVLRVKVLVPVH